MTYLVAVYPSDSEKYVEKWVVNSPADVVDNEGTLTVMSVGTEPQRKRMMGKEILTPGTRSQLAVYPRGAWGKVVIRDEIQPEESTDLKEGDKAVLQVSVYRLDSTQALIEFKSMEGPFSVRVPLSELTRAGKEGES